jgi:fibronectin-binding autotransporter adhesin
MATWKKVIVSGSDASLNELYVRTSVQTPQLNVGTNQQISTAQSTTFLTGSFTGSFKGNGSGLTHVTGAAVFPTSVLTPLTSATKLFANDGANNKTISAGQITASAYAGVSGDITINAAGVAAIAANSVALGTDTTGDYVATITPGAGLTGGSTSGEGVAHTLAVGEGSHITVHDVDINVNTTTLIPAVWAQSASYSGSIIDVIAGDVNVTAAGVSSIGSGVIVNADVHASAAIVASKINFSGTSFVSASTLSSPSQGNAVLTVNGIAGSTIDLGLQAADSPSFVGLTLTGDAAVNGGDITTTATTATVFNTTATTVNAFGAATSLNLGAATGTTTVGNKLVVTGDLQVNGDLVTLNTANLNVEDKFILLNSGSSTATDESGIIFGGANGTAGSGSALIWNGDYNSSDGRLAIANSVGATDSTATVSYYIAGVFDGTEANAATAQADHNGNIRIESGDIFIYS